MKSTDDCGLKIMKHAIVVIFWNLWFGLRHPENFHTDNFLYFCALRFFGLNLFHMTCFKYRWPLYVAKIGTVLPWTTQIFRSYPSMLEIRNMFPRHGSDLLFVMCLGSSDRNIRLEITSLATNQKSYGRAVGIEYPFFQVLIRLHRPAWNSIRGKSKGFEFGSYLWVPKARTFLPHQFCQLLRFPDYNRFEQYELIQSV